MPMTRRTIRPDRQQSQRAPSSRARSVDLSPLTALVGFSVRVAQLQVFEQFHRELWRRHHVHPGAYSVLVAIKANPGIQPGLLAGVLAVKRPNMTKLLDTLERRGWIKRQQQKTDGRGVTLFLTADGEQKISRVAEEAMAMDVDATACLTERERAQLITLLEKLSVHLRGLNERRSLVRG